MAWEWLNTFTKQQNKLWKVQINQNNWISSLCSLLVCLTLKTNSNSLNSTELFIVTLKTYTFAGRETINLRCRNYLIWWESQKSLNIVVELDITLFQSWNIVKLQKILKCISDTVIQLGMNVWGTQNHYHHSLQYSFAQYQSGLLMHLVNVPDCIT